MSTLFYYAKNDKFATHAPKHYEKEAAIEFLSDLFSILHDGENHIISVGTCTPYEFTFILNDYAEEYAIYDYGDRSIGINGDDIKLGATERLNPYKMELLRSTSENQFDFRTYIEYVGHNYKYCETHSIAFAVIGGNDDWAAYAGNGNMTEAEIVKSGNKMGKQAAIELFPHLSHLHYRT